MGDVGRGSGASWCWRLPGQLRFDSYAGSRWRARLYNWHCACVSPSRALPFFVEARRKVDLDGCRPYPSAVSHPRRYAWWLSLSLSLSSSDLKLVMFDLGSILLAYNCRKFRHRLKKISGYMISESVWYVWLGKFRSDFFFLSIWEFKSKVGKICTGILLSEISIAFMVANCGCSVFFSSIWELKSKVGKICSGILLSEISIAFIVANCGCSFFFCFNREKDDHRELCREHKGNRGDAWVLQREGPEFHDWGCEDGLR